MKHKHKFQLLGRSLVVLLGGNIVGKMRESEYSVDYVCECGKVKEVKLKK